MNLQCFVDKTPPFPNLLTRRGPGVGRLATIFYRTILVGSLIGHGAGGEDAMINADVESLARVLRSRGCDAPSPWTFDRSQTNHINRTIGDDDRSFYVHLPPSYNLNTAHAVVLSFHGYMGSDLDQESISAFSQNGLTVNGRVGSDVNRSAVNLPYHWIWGRVSSQFTRRALGVQERMAVPDSVLGRVPRMPK